VVGEVDLKTLRVLQTVLIKPEDLVAEDLVEKLLKLLIWEEQETHLLYLHLKVNQVDKVLEDQQLLQVNLDLLVVVAQVLQEVVIQSKEMMDNLEALDNLL
jgi:hypothetical protein